jgi:hypothetical protein
MPGSKHVGEVLWCEVVRAVFEGGVHGKGQNGWGQAYFDKVKILEEEKRLV